MWCGACNFRDVGGPCPGLPAVVCQKLDVPSGTVFQHELKSARSADSGYGWRGEAENGPLRKLAQLLVHARLDFLILLRSGIAVTPWLQSDEKEAVVTCLDKAQQAEANNAGRVLDAWGVGEDLLNLSPRCAGALQRSRVRKLHVDEEIALVFIGQEAG